MNQLLEKAEPLPLKQQRFFRREVLPLLEGKRTQDAEKSLLNALNQWPKATFLYQKLAELYLEQNRRELAITHLERAFTSDRTNLAVARQLSRLLYEKGQYEAALPSLRVVVERSPENSAAWFQLATALRKAAQYEEAAKAMKRAHELAPHSSKIEIDYVASLEQAGAVEEAEAVGGRYLSSTSERLPSQFAAGIAAIWQRPPSRKLPRKLLEWAWRLVRQQGGDRRIDPHHWHEEVVREDDLDNYLRDWLACRPEQIEEAMHLLADLTPLEEAIQSRSNGSGTLLAIAHVGALYASYPIMELLGVDYALVAALPALRSMHFADRLISTSQLTEMQVARRILSVLRRDGVIGVAVDGRINHATPTVDFEGEKVTYSEFASRAAYKMGTPSLVVFPYWNGEQFDSFIRPMPEVSDSPNADHYATAWREAYFAALKEFIGLHPTSMKLRGGIWRSVR